MVLVLDAVTVLGLRIKRVESRYKVAVGAKRGCRLTSSRFFECLTNPDCEQCHSTHAAAATATSSAGSSSASSSTAKNTTTTSSSAAPVETCPQFCDCSSIEDKQSEE